MHSKTTVPLFTTNKLTETRSFYHDYLGFEAFMDCDEYLGLRLADGGAELGFMPESDGHPLSSGDGLLYCFAVEDIATVYEQLKSKGAPVDGPPEDMPWGDRRLTLKDPNGITVYIGQPIAAATDCSS